MLLELARPTHSISEQPRTTVIFLCMVILVSQFSVELELGGLTLASRLVLTTDAVRAAYIAAAETLDTTMMLIGMRKHSARR